MTTYTTPSYLEDRSSQVPALMLLANLGWEYLTPGEAVAQRGGRLGGVILEGILERQLRGINVIRTKGGEYAFSEGNIQAAMEALTAEIFDGLVRTNEKVYELLTLGKSLPQRIGGDQKSHPFWYIDWEHPEKNAYHVSEEFRVERRGSKQVLIPDIVLFVNGIPLAVIECKPPVLEQSARKRPVEQAISQQLRNQHEDAIPHLFVFSQLLLAVASNEAMYGTTGTGLKFWSVWQEEALDEEALRELVNRPVPGRMWRHLFGTGEMHEGDEPYFASMAESAGRKVTEQDRALYALCRPERLLELSHRYVVFEAGTKKIARYQQYFCVLRLLERIRRRDERGRREGGVVWHTQGSGKSLTMVMFAKALALEQGLHEYKLVLVTDRVDLDEQIRNVFRNTGHDVRQARTGWNLGDLLNDRDADVISTVIDKFETAVGKAEVRNESPDIFVLVDEGHRTQHSRRGSGYGERHLKMRQALPNACYIGFTGTPLMTTEKQTATLFGGIIDTYPIRQAVEDKAVVPLLYEGRFVPQIVDREPLDQWFDRYTEELTPEQKADLKRKCSHGSQIQKSRRTIMQIAYDVSKHYQENLAGTPYKGQLVTMSKAAALLYKECLDEFGMVSSEVLISGPDDREGNDEHDAPNRDEIVRFWEKMMARFGSEKQYNQAIINAFKSADEPGIIIVVDKLLTGFDAPCNTVLYLHKNLKGHNLLQAIARVNRLYEGKDFGYIIDYYGVLGQLDEALDLYGGLPGFDQDDLFGALQDVREEIQKLPTRHAELWQLFSSIANKQDNEAFQQLLADEALRARFYERLSAYARTLQTALGSLTFREETSEARIDRYRHDLAFFSNLRAAVRRRYAETVDFGEYERRIQKLIDAHVGTLEVEKLTEQVDIFNTEAFAKEVEKVTGTASKADTIAHRTKRTLKEKWEEEDPAFYKKFSRLIEDAIDDFRQHRISDVEYLQKVKEIMSHVVNRTGDDIPERLQGEQVAVAFYGLIGEALEARDGESETLQELKVQAALDVDAIIRKLRIVHWEDNDDIKNRMRNAIEDRLFELQDAHGIRLSFDEIDAIMESCIRNATIRYAS